MKSLMLALALMFLCGAVAAQTDTDKALVNISATATPLNEVAQTLTKQLNIPVVTDLTTPYTGALANVTIDQALDAITGSTQSKWFMVTIPKDTAVDQILTVAKRQARSIEQVSEPKEVLVFDPATKSQYVFKLKPSNAREAVASANEMGLRLVYLVTSPQSSTAAARSANASADIAVDQAGYAAMTRKQHEAFLAMTPEERIKAMEASMKEELSMAPAQRAQLALARSQAMRQLRQSNPDWYQQYRNTQRETYRQLQSQGALPSRETGNRRGGRDGQRSN